MKFDLVSTSLGKRALTTEHDEDPWFLDVLYQFMDFDCYRWSIEEEDPLDFI